MAGPSPARCIYRQPTTHRVVGSGSNRLTIRVCCGSTQTFSGARLARVLIHDPSEGLCGCAVALRFDADAQPEHLVSATQEGRTSVSGSMSLAARINRVVDAQLYEPRRRMAARTRLLTTARDSDEIRFSETTAEAVVRRGLKASVLAELSGATGIDVEHLFEFAGIDRTTVSRRVARDDVLPQEASVRPCSLPI